MKQTKDAIRRLQEEIAANKNSSDLGAIVDKFQANFDKNLERVKIQLKLCLCDVACYTKCRFLCRSDGMGSL